MCCQPDSPAAWRAVPGGMAGGSTPTIVPRRVAVDLGTVTGESNPRPLLTPMALQGAPGMSVPTHGARWSFGFVQPTRQPGSLEGRAERHGRGFESTQCPDITHVERGIEPRAMACAKALQAQRACIGMGVGAPIGAGGLRCERLAYTSAKATFL